MITRSKITKVGNDVIYEFNGLSTDIKPLNDFDGIKITNGSTLYCMDNGTAFMYDEQNNKWLAQ